MTKQDLELNFTNMPRESEFLDEVNDKLAQAYDSEFEADYPLASEAHLQSQLVSTQTKTDARAETKEDTKRMLMDWDDSDNGDDDEWDEQDGFSMPKVHADNTKSVLTDTKSVLADNKSGSQSSSSSKYSREALAGLQPTTAFNTAAASVEQYVPMLPLPKANTTKRQLVLDTETTGLEALNGDRIIEVGIVEVVNRRFSGEKLHVYINPERDMDAEAVAVHGISMDFLADKPVFAEIGEQVLDFIEGAEIIAHNAPFDMGFLDMEFKKLGVHDFLTRVSVIDSLAVAKSHYPGQKNSLDALVKRLEIVTKDRTFHGALLDAEILADVYLTMTGGQVSLSLGETSASRGEHKHFSFAFSVCSAGADELAAHQSWLEGMKQLHPNFEAQLS